MTDTLVVLDTNCLVSALIFSRGSMSWLRQAWQTEQVVPVVCRETVDELVRVLAYPKFALAQDGIETLLGEFLPWARPVALDPLLHEISGIRDPDDAVFVQLAWQTGAIFLVSEDRHLLELQAAFSRLRILSPAQFKVELERSAHCGQGLGAFRPT